MVERDERWEDVFAWIRTAEDSWAGPDKGYVKLFDNEIELRIGVRYHGQLCQTVIRLDKIEVERTYGDGLKKTLDEMVREMDKYLDGVFDG